jgi:hypothetical protein
MDIHPRADTSGPRRPPFPVLDPALTYGEIRAGARRELPGAHQRRQLHFRYTLDWTKPEPPRVL